MGFVNVAPAREPATCWRVIGGTLRPVALRWDAVAELFRIAPQLRIELDPQLLVITMKPSRFAEGASL